MSKMRLNSVHLRTDEEHTIHCGEEAIDYKLFFFFKDLILFIFGCFGSSLLRAGFL